MKRKILLIVVFILLINKLSSKNKEVVFNATSLFMFQNDTIKKSYLKAKKLFNNADYTNSLRLALKIKDDKNIDENKEVQILNSFLISKIFYTTKSIDNSLKYYKKTLSYINNFSNKNYDFDKALSYSHSLLEAETKLGIANSYYNLNITKGLTKFKDSALVFYKEVKNGNSLDNNVLKIRSKANINLSVMYMNDGFYTKAKNSALEAIEIHKKLNDKVNEAAALGNLSSIYLLEGNYEDAKKIYFEAIDLIRNINSNESLKVREDLYYNLAYNLYKLKDYEAYTYQELSYILKDSLRDKEFRGMIAEITEKYNFESKKKLLLKVEENKRLQAEKTFWIYGIGSFIIILSLLYGLNFYKLKQKNLGLKLSQTKLIQNQNLEKLKSESQTRILNATIDGKESERKQIAETLHDSVSALLSSANLHLQATRKQFNGNTPIEIDKTQEIITEASQKIRDLSHTLVSSVLLKFGINFAIKDLAEKYSNSQLTIETDIENIRRYHQNFEIKAYNIIQEFLNNILKHSNAENATIFIREKNNNLCIKISDDGQGFDKATITKKDGLGLNQIDARIQVMNGKFDIDSEFGKGTKIIVELPVLEKDTFNLV